jgi:ACT domain-containing protein
MERKKIPMKSILIKGVRYVSIAEACKRYGISESTYHKRRQRGWGVERALETPLKKNQHA